MDARHAEDRRGRRASWVALLLVGVGLAGAFVLLRPWYAAERYERLRVHVTRADRAEIEARIDADTARPGVVTLLVTVDALNAAASDARPLADYRTLDSLASLAVNVTVRGAVTQESLARALAREAVGNGVRSVAVPGRADGLDLDGLRRDFSTVRVDRPQITEHLDEGSASWATLCGIDAVRHDGDVFLWLRLAELLPPLVGHTEFRVLRPRSERAAIEHYLGRLLEYLRVTRSANRIRVLVTNENARHVMIVGGTSLAGLSDAAETSVDELCHALYGAGRATKDPRGSGD